MISNKVTKKIVRKELIINKGVPFEFIEAYKSLRTNLQFASISSNIKKILVTSSIPGEGKTTVALNLALTLAENGHKVLLIDADLRKPYIHKYLNISAKNMGGLTSLLAGITSIENSIAYLSDLGISVMISGPIPPNPTELLGSRKLENIIELLCKDYDYIILDTPPVSVVTDAAIVSRLVDGVLFVIRQGFTTYGEAIQAKENLIKVNANVIGCVYNALEGEKSNKYYHYKKYSYSYK
jgi:capsular exopolysaccharide synthesis family protein